MSSPVPSPTLFPCLVFLVGPLSSDLPAWLLRPLGEGLQCPARLYAPLCRLWAGGTWRQCPQCPRARRQENAERLLAVSELPVGSTAPSGAPLWVGLHTLTCVLVNF